MRIGVDIGGSLTKMVAINGDDRHFRLLEHTNAADVAADIGTLVTKWREQSPEHGRQDQKRHTA